VVPSLTRRLWQGSNAGAKPVRRSLILAIAAVVTLVAVALVFLLLATIVIPALIIVVMTVVAAVILAVFLTSIALLTLIVRNVFAVVPVVLHKIDPLPAGAVLVAVLAPVLCMTRRHVQVDRRAHDRHPLNDDRLWVDQLRRRIAANVDAPVETGLADAYRYAKVGGKHRRCRDDQCGGEEKTFHAGPVGVDVVY